MKTGAGAERVEQLGGHEAFVPDHVGLTGFEQVDRGGGGFDREKIDDIVSLFPHQQKLEITLLRL